MSTDQRPDRTAKALREYGRLIESNFVLRWSADPDMRQRSHGQLNKGESANSLRREVGVSTTSSRGTTLSVSRRRV